MEIAEGRTAPGRQRPFILPHGLDGGVGMSGRLRRTNEVIDVECAVGQIESIPTIRGDHTRSGPDQASES